MVLSKTVLLFAVTCTKTKLHRFVISQTVEASGIYQNGLFLWGKELPLLGRSKVTNGIIFFKWYQYTNIDTWEISYATFLDFLNVTKMALIGPETTDKSV